MIRPIVIELLTIAGIAVLEFFVLIVYVATRPDKPKERRP